MRTAVVTHRLLHNYGGVLQAWAMQQALLVLGHDPVTIDWQPPGCTRKRQLLANAKTALLRLAGRGRDRRWVSRIAESRREDFERFLQSNLQLGHTVSTHSMAELRALGAEAVVVGSDQVWRRAFHRSQRLYEDMFLRFVGRNELLRISYAASFGTGSWECSPKETSRVSRLAGRFSAISVREHSGVALCRRYLGVEALQMPDPTMLMEWRDYLSLCNEQPEHNHAPSEDMCPRMFAYILDHTRADADRLRGIARCLGAACELAGAESQVQMSVEEWLFRIDRAGHMVTNSFHGTVMALLSHTQFVTLPHAERGEARVRDLLQDFGLGDRIVASLADTAVIAAKLAEPIDWQRVDRHLESLRQRGMTYLDKALQGLGTAEIARLL